MARSAAAAACAARAACRAAFSDAARAWARGQLAGQLVPLALGQLDERLLPARGGLDGHLEVVRRPQVGLLGHQQLVRLVPEHPGHRVVGLVGGQRLGAPLGQDLPHPDLAQVGLRAVGVADHRRHRVEAAAGLELLGGQAGHPLPAGGLLLFGLPEPGLGHLVGRGGPLLVHLGLVVTLGQYLGLGLQPGQLRAGGRQLALLRAEGGLVLPDLVLRRLDLGGARRLRVALQPRSRGSGRAEHHQQTAGRGAAEHHEQPAPECRALPGVSWPP